MVTTALPKQQTTVADLISEASGLCESKPLLALELAREALKLASHHNDDAERYESLVVLCSSHQRLGQNAEALKSGLEALKLKASAKLHTSLGIIYLNLGEHSQALKHYLEALKLSPEADLVGRAATLNALAILYHRHANYLKELHAYEEAQHLYERAGDQHGLALVLKNLAMVHLALGNTEIAIEKAEKACSIAASINAKPLWANARCTLGEIMLAADRPNEALTHLQEGLALATTIGTEFIALYSMRLMGKAYLKINYPDAAIAILCEALPKAKQVGDKQELAECHLALALAYKIKRAYKESLHHHECHHQLEQEVFNSEADRNLKNLQILHETERAKTVAQMAQKRAAELERRVAERTQELEHTHIEVLERLAMIAEHRDGETGEHTHRVGKLASLIAKELRCDEMTIANLKLAARLHDIGKIGIPDAILLKPDKLTPEEFELIKRHTVLGARMLTGSNSSLMQMAKTIALSHHERWDGTGYPLQAKSNAIPLVGRIVAVADSYDALINKRPYKEAWAKENALEEIKRSSGSQFDPEVVEAFLRII